MRRQDRIFIITAIFIAVVLFLATLYVWNRPDGTADTSSGEESTSTASTSDGTLAAPEDFLPGNLQIGEPLPSDIFEDADGNEVSLEQWRGQRLWLVYWASWCPDCEEQLAMAEEMQKAAEEKDVTVILLDRLNPEKESIQAAQEALTRLGITWTCLYDTDEKNYKAWGCGEIPTHVVLDEAGNVTALASNTQTAGECRGLLSKGVDGADAAVLSFLRSRMTGEDGGVYTGTRNSTSSPSGRDVLSESQGMLMSYAVQKNDPDLFAEAWGYVNQNMLEDGLVRWMVSADGEGADSDALLDDLRIWEALQSAAEQWNSEEYQQAADQIRDGVESRLIGGDGGLVDYCTLKKNKPADRLSLRYIDVTTLRAMESAGSTDAFSAAVEDAEQILLNGRISDDFPLYYAAYDYGSSSYSTENLNTSEALMTLLHLAEAGELGQDSLAWLRQQVKAGTLAARYQVDGSVVTGNDYYSSAVYALAALIGEQAGDPELTEEAVRRMERVRDDDADDAYYGSFGTGERNRYSFDQLLPLLVYAGRDRAEVRRN